jgi:hypothetical protein
MEDENNIANQESHKEQPDNFYPLDEVAIEMFAQGIKQIGQITSEMNGALKLFCRQQKLQGKWTLAENGKELQRVTGTPMAVQPGQ